MNMNNNNQQFLACYQLHRKYVTLNNSFKHTYLALAGLFVTKLLILDLNQNFCSQNSYQADKLSVSIITITNSAYKSHIELVRIFHFNQQWVSWFLWNLLHLLIFFILLFILSCYQSIMNNFWCYTGNKHSFN